MGSRITIPMLVRAKTSTNGERSLTAIRMKRYGIPQITHIARNKKRARRFIGGEEP
jgi:hypothetical protein